MTEETKVEQTNGAAPEVANTAAQPPAPETADNDLNINDLNAMKQIIDLASSRGAFKAAEMEAVGKIYNKLSNFLAQVAAKGQQNG
jgi:hypothetical protein